MKQGTKKRLQIPDNILQDAIKAVHDGIMNISQAAANFGIPRTTLSDWVKNPDRRHKIGRPTLLTDSEELVVRKFLQVNTEELVPLSFAELQRLLHEVVKRCRSGTEVTSPEDEEEDSRMFSYGWLQGFCERNKISLRVTQALSSARQIVSQEFVHQWCQKQEAHLRASGLWEAMEDPSRVYDLDECPLPDVTTARKVLVNTGTKCVSSRVAGEPKSNRTVLVCGNANGDLAPIFILFSQKRRPQGYESVQLPGVHISVSPKGYITTPTFLEYLHIFNTWLLTKEVEKPVIVFTDLHASRLSPDVAEYASTNGIRLMGLPGNTTHIMQPLDVGVMKPIKDYFKDEYCRWSRDNFGVKFDVKAQISAMQRAVQRGASPENLKAGFAACGLFPWDKERPSYDRLSKTPRTQGLVAARVMEGVHFTQDSSLPCSLSVPLVEHGTQTCAWNVSAAATTEDMPCHPQLSQEYLKDVLRTAFQTSLHAIADVLADSASQILFNYLLGNEQTNVLVQSPVAPTGVSSGPVPNQFHVVDLDEHTEVGGSTTAHDLYIRPALKHVIEEQCGKIQMKVNKTSTRKRLTKARRIAQETNALELTSSAAIAILKTSAAKTAKRGCGKRKKRELTEMEKLQERASQKRLRLVDNPGEGNCLFHAAAQQVNGLSHSTLREMTVKSLQDEEAINGQLHNFLSESETWDAYLRRMKQDGEWGDHLAIKGLSLALKRDIIVISANGDDTEMPYCGEQNLPAMYIGHTGNHFVTLLTESTDVAETDNTKCCVCGHLYMQTQEDWLRCTKCHQWACETCFTVEYCYNCTDSQ